MANPRDRYYTKMYETLVYYNYRNYAPVYNEKTRQAVSKVIVKEKVDAQNVTADTFWKNTVKPNT